MEESLKSMYVIHCTIHLKLAQHSIPNLIFFLKIHSYCGMKRVHHFLQAFLQPGWWTSGVRPLFFDFSGTLYGEAVPWRTRLTTLDIGSICVSNRFFGSLVNISQSRTALSQSEWTDAIQLLPSQSWETDCGSSCWDNAILRTNVSSHLDSPLTAFLKWITWKRGIENALKMLTFKAKPRWRKGM